MDIRAAKFDPISARMRAAMVAHATASLHHAARLRPGTPFEDIPVLTKADLAARSNEFFTAGVPEDPARREC